MRIKDEEILRIFVLPFNCLITELVIFREKLEKKALLYDHLSQAPSSSKDQSDEYLVNFGKKSKEDSAGNVPVSSSSTPADDTHYDDDSDDEW